MKNRPSEDAGVSRSRTKRKANTFKSKPAHHFALSLRRPSPLFSARLRLSSLVASRLRFSDSVKRRKQNHTPIFPLGDDFIFAEILPKLPVRSLTRFKCVSQTWRARISGESSFLAAHLNHQAARDPHLIAVGRNANDHKLYLNIVPPSMLLSNHCSNIEEVKIPYANRESRFRFFGSCNGLVCLLKFMDLVLFGFDLILLWNPATRQVRKIPLPKWKRFGFMGFGYDATSRDYKLFNIVIDDSAESPCLRVDVFTRSGAVWREAQGRQGVPGLRYRFKHHLPVEANGVLHWEAHDSSGIFILSLGLSDEVLQRCDAPSGNFNWVMPCNWRGSLAAVTWDVADCVLWVAMSGGSDLRWSKLFKMGPQGMIIGLWREQLVCKMNTRNRRRIVLNLRELKDEGHVRRIQMPKRCHQIFNAYEYFESMASVY